MGLGFCGSVPKSTSSNFSPTVTCVYFSVVTPFLFYVSLLSKFLGPHSTLNFYVVILVQDPLAHYRWAPRTFITCRLSCRQVFEPWRIMAYHLTLKWVLLSSSSFILTALSSRALGHPGCPLTWGWRCLVVWTLNFHQTVPIHHRTWFLLSGL